MNSEEENNFLISQLDMSKIEEIIKNKGEISISLPRCNGKSHLAINNFLKYLSEYESDDYDD